VPRAQRVLGEGRRRARKIEEKDDKGEREVDLDKKLGEALSEMRLIKDEHRGERAREVVDATKRGFEDVIWSLRRRRASARSRAPSTSARASRATTSATARSRRAAPTPASSTGRATTAPLKRRDLLLLDAGIEGNQLYTADITRTLPISGKFSKEQRRGLRPRLRRAGSGARRREAGNDFMEPNKRRDEACSPRASRRWGSSRTPSRRSPPSSSSRSGTRSTT
jgi:Xaa-Pro aminopeptidase